jgi:outer membrane protein TolC
VARARLQLNRVQAHLHQIELQVATDVTNAAINVEAGSSACRRQRSRIAENAGSRTESKFEVGMSTSYNVILTQRDLRPPRPTAPGI